MQARAARGEPVELSRVVALQVMSDGQAKNGGNTPVNEDAVRRNERLVREEPGYQAFAEDPNSLELLKTGQVPQLVVSYRDHTNAAQRPEPGKPLAEPEKQEPEAEAEAEAGAGGNG